MALLHMDGFDAGDFALRYTVAGPPVTTSTTRFSSGYAMSIITNGRYLDFPIAASSAVYVGAAMYNTDNTATGTIIVLYGDAGVTEHVSLQRVSSTAIGVYRGATQLGTYSFTPSGWFYVELYATINDSTGAVTVRINESAVITLTSQDTKNGGTATTIDKIRIGSTTGTGGRPYVDDLYVSDSGFMGDRRIQILTPNAAGSSTDLTPTGSATNYDNVTEIPDDTATYNGSAVAADLDLYGLTNLASGTISVDAVQVVTHSYKSDSGTRSMKAALKSGATTYYGATTALPTSVGCVVDIWEEDPDITAAWTPTTVNALEIGAEVV